MVSSICSTTLASDGQYLDGKRGADEGRRDKPSIDHLMACWLNITVIFPAQPVKRAKIDGDSPEAPPVRA